MLLGGRDTHKKSVNSAPKWKKNSGKDKIIGEVQLRNYDRPGNPRTTFLRNNFTLLLVLRNIHSILNGESPVSAANQLRDKYSLITRMDSGAAEFQKG